MAKPRFVLILVLVVVIIVILAALAAYYLSQAGSGPAAQACSGVRTYSGTVTDTAGAGLGGVVVALTPTSPGVGSSAAVTSSASGAWSASVSGVCPYTATLYWQSASAGPRLATAATIPATYDAQVNVTRATVTLQFLAEFPNSAGVNASLFLPANNLTFSVDAVTSGTIPLGFLPLDSGGERGYNFTYPQETNRTNATPFALVDTGALAYRVGDENGHWVVYAVPGSAPALTVTTATDGLNMTAAIALAQAAGANPYVTVGAHATSTPGASIASNATHVALGTAGTAFGIPLPGFLSVVTQGSPQTYPTSQVTLTNAGGGNVCYVVYTDVLNLHAWFYATGRCP